MFDHFVGLVVKGLNEIKILQSTNAKSAQIPCNHLASTITSVITTTSTIKTIEKDVKYFSKLTMKTPDNVNGLVLVFLLLTSM